MDKTFVLLVMVSLVICLLISGILLWSHEHFIQAGLFLSPADSLKQNPAISPGHLLQFAGFVILAVLFMTCSAISYLLWRYNVWKADFRLQTQRQQQQNWRQQTVRLANQPNSASQHPWTTG